MYIIKGNTNYFLVALSEHAEAIKVELESGEVREDRVREPYCWDSIELRTCLLIRDREKRKRDSKSLTNGSPFKYQLMKRETTTNNPASNDALSVNSSGMVTTRKRKKTN
jgi:hypothetical protein